MTQVYEYSIINDTLSGMLYQNSLCNELFEVAGFVGIHTDGFDKLFITADQGAGDNIAPIVAAHITLAEQKRIKKENVDIRTKELIDTGFIYDSKTFSLSIEAQINWIALKTLENILTFPVEITTMNDEAYSLILTSLDAFVLAASAAKQTHLDSGRSLKVAIDTATNQNEFDAIIDNR